MFSVAQTNTGNVDLTVSKEIGSYPRRLLLLWEHSADSPTMAESPPMGHKPVQNTRRKVFDDLMYGKGL